MVPVDCCPPAGVSAAAVWVVAAAAGFGWFGCVGVAVAAPAAEGFGWFGCTGVAVAAPADEGFG